MAFAYLGTILDMKGLSRWWMHTECVSRTFWDMLLLNSAALRTEKNRHFDYYTQLGKSF